MSTTVVSSTVFLSLVVSTPLCVKISLKVGEELCFINGLILAITIAAPAIVSYNVLIFFCVSNCSFFFWKVIILPNNSRYFVSSVISCFSSCISVFILFASFIAANNNSTSNIFLMSLGNAFIAFSSFIRPLLL